MLTADYVFWAAVAFMAGTTRGAGVAAVLSHRGRGPRFDAARCRAGELGHRGFKRATRG